MPKQILYFATNDDLREGLSRLESSFSVKYARHQMSENPEIRVFDSHSEITDLGTSIAGSKEDLPRYIIVPSDITFLSRRIDGGRTLYCVDTFINPLGMTFVSSAEHAGCLLYGSVMAGDSSEIFQKFTRFVFKGFEKIRSFKVSPGAAKVLDNGGRLTPNIKAQKIMDLTRP